LKFELLTVSGLRLFSLKGSVGRNSAQGEHCHGANAFKSRTPNDQ